MNLVCLDFETANEQRNSVCAAGIVVLTDGVVVDKRKWLVRPPELRFDAYNSFIHGITEDHVHDQPEFNQLWPELRELLVGGVVVCHNAGFDFSVLRRVLDTYNLPYPLLTFSCSRIISKAMWPGWSSYSLPYVARQLGIAMQHHDPVDDARAAGEIVTHACLKSGVSSIEELCMKLDLVLGQLVVDAYKPSHLKVKKLSAKDIVTQSETDPSNVLYGQFVVFTGTLQSMDRVHAMQCVADVGGQCQDSVTKKTNFLVLGDGGFQGFVEGQKSNKIEKAEALLAKGADIEIISEKEFLTLLRSS